MRLSFSTNAYVLTTVTDAVQRIAARGYSGVELLADAPHLFADGLTAADLDQLAETLEACGIAVANINANTAAGYYSRSFWEPLFEPSMAHPDPELRAWRVAYTRKCVDMARRFGCRNVSVTSGRAVPGTPPERAMENLVESLSMVLDHAARHGIRIGVEYEPGLLIENCGELLHLLDRLRCSNLGANLDLGHSHVLGEDAGTVLGTLGEKVFHLHIEDIRGRKHYHLIPGEGDMDFARIFSSLREVGYDGFLTVELYTCPDRPDEAAARAFEHLSRYLQPERGKRK